MICDDCVKKDVCKYKSQALADEMCLHTEFLEITCKHKHVLYPDEWISDPYSHTEGADYTPRR